ncbi:MAG: hypothetical protein M3271_07640 [Actinomycetota bacterium]|nr:hypothetical protein [Actinomycetota bacterium]
MMSLLAELGVEFAELIAHAISSVAVRVKGWLQYRRLYSAAERREHARQLAAGSPRAGAATR